MEQEVKKSNGAFFGSIVIIIILILGGIYVFYAKMQEIKNNQAAQEALRQAQEEANKTQSAN